VLTTTQYLDLLSYQVIGCGVIDCCYLLGKDLDGHGLTSELCLEDLTKTSLAKEILSAKEINQCMNYIQRLILYAPNGLNLVYSDGLIDWFSTHISSRTNSLGATL